jgi:alpha-galactosidase
VDVFFATIIPMASARQEALVGAASGRCLDVPGGNTANGTQPIIWDCNGNANSNGRSTATAPSAVSRPAGAPMSTTT